MYATRKSLLDQWPFFLYTRTNHPVISLTLFILFITRQVYNGTNFDHFSSTCVGLVSHNEKTYASRRLWPLVLLIHMQISDVQLMQKKAWDQSTELILFVTTVHRFCQFAISRENTEIKCFFLGVCVCVFLDGATTKDHRQHKMPEWSQCISRWPRTWMGQ